MRSPADGEETLMIAAALRLAATLQRGINDWFLNTAGGEDRRAFYDIDDTCPALRRIDEAYPQIRAEAMALLGHRQDIPRLHDTDPGQECISAHSPNDWRVFYLTLMGAHAEPNRAACPRTSAVLDTIPGLFQACFSILDPGKSVPPHRGPYGGYLRYHLGLVVPEQNPPSLRVKDEVYTWRQGDSTLFDDSLEHEVFNSCSEARVVLIVDVSRPMPPVQRLVNGAVKRVARRVYGRPTLQKALDYTAPAP
jgi:aspartyl/asparaginyl beta-hydroxylase (cupin superfamily)